MGFEVITRKNAIFEYLDCQIPVTQLKGQREMEICKQQSEIKMRHLPTIDRFKRYGSESGRGQFFLDQSIGIDETNTFQLTFYILNENCRRHRFGRFVNVRVGVAYLRNRLALLTRLRNLNLRSHFSIFDSFRDIRVHTDDFFKFVGGLWVLKWAWQTCFGSIGRH